MDLCIGQLVKSKAGHDKGKYFLIYQIIDDKYVSIVDGKTRRLEKPKKKKQKHLAKVNKVSEFMINIDTKDAASQNKQITREIQNLLEK